MSTTLTDKQLKVLRYIKKRVTPPTVRDIALQTKIDKGTVYALMTRLSRLGCVESFLKKDPNRPHITAERHYKFITMDPEVKETKTKKENLMYCKKFAKTRVTMPEPFYSDPFNMTGARNANQQAKARVNTHKEKKE